MENMRLLGVLWVCSVIIIAHNNYIIYNRSLTLARHTHTFIIFACFIRIVCSVTWARARLYSKWISEMEEDVDDNGYYRAHHMCATYLCQRQSDNTYTHWVVVRLRSSLACQRWVYLTKCRKQQQQIIKASHDLFVIKVLSSSKSRARAGM